MILEMVTSISGNKNQDELLDRFASFAIDCAALVRSTPRSDENRIYGKQLIRSSSSMGANYAEPTAAASRKDFINDANRSRKEARESLYWLGLLKQINPKQDDKSSELIKECEELAKILTAIVKSSKGI